jgi:hypothetical protein
MSLQDPKSNNWFYWKDRKKMVKVHAEVIFSLQDQPERRGAHYLMLGSGVHSPRWLKSYNYNKLSNGIQPCSRCYNKNKQKLKFLSSIQDIHYNYPDDEDDSGKNVVNVLIGIRVTTNNLVAFHHHMTIQTQNIL